MVDNIHKSEDYKIKHTNINKYRVTTQITFNIIQKSVTDYRSSWYTFLQIKNENRTILANLNYRCTDR